MKNNTRLRHVYTNMLKYIKKRYDANPAYNPTEIERKFIDVLKTIIEGGYSIGEKEFYDILEKI